MGIYGNKVFFVGIIKSFSFYQKKSCKDCEKLEIIELIQLLIEN